jgi:class 3 adenylate cyclase/tetratricopeptide (TPR) repeat protein
MQTCPSCGGANPDGFRFCGDCGSPLAAAAERREERKVVTCLFCDLVGFTSRAERMDPEDVRALLGPYHARVRSELERFGGTVEKFIGDAVMALFGAPVAHEDDPDRAVRAALAIRDWAVGQGEGLQVRIGINTGEALVTLGARPREGEPMATGDVVNTAARLQTAAPVNGILVSESTHRATEHAIAYERRAAVEAKGKSDPVEAWEALDVLAGPDADVFGHTRTPLVGRTRELSLLVSTLARVREERSPELVTLIGVPGIGKSRLVYELAHAVETDREPIWWRQGRSLPYGDGGAFWALAEIVKAQAGILESDRAEQVEGRLHQAIAQVADDPAERQWLERHLRPLVGLPHDEPPDPQETFAAWRRFLEALAEQRTLVLVLEDLHWGDEAFLDFVDRLIARTSRVPLMVLATARPELLTLRPDWGGGKPNALAVSLSPLSDEETARLLSALLERPMHEAEAWDQLLGRVGGNPLWAEQYARIVLEGGDVQELPQSVQGIIAARLDALSEEEKALLQDAAVIGNVFWLGALEAIGGVSRWQAEELLYRLERSELVQRDHRSSVAGETEYRFRHVLTRDVAYGTIPRATRSAKHQRAAAWIASLGRPHDHAPMLAHHHVHALELAEAAGLDTRELVEPAWRALRAAGDRASALSSPQAAERFYEEALQLCPADDPERSQLLFRHAASTATWGGGSPERLIEARDALLAAGDATTAAEAEMLLADTYRMEGRGELAGEAVERALPLLGDARPSRSTASVLRGLANRMALTGSIDRALAIGAEALAMADLLGWDVGRADALVEIGSSRVMNGDRGGLEDLTRSVEIATEEGAIATLSRAHNNLSVAHQILGEIEPAYRARLEAARIAERLGSPSSSLWFRGVMTDFAYRRGEWEEADRLAEGLMAEVEGGPTHYILWQVLAIRAAMRLARGDADGAVRYAEDALATARAAAEWQALYFTLAQGAYVSTAVSDGGRASALIDELLESLRARVLVGFAVINLPSAAIAAVRLGRAGELVAALAGHPRTPWTEVVEAYARGRYPRAAEILQAIGSRPDEAAARIRAGEALLAEGARAAATEQLERSLAFWRSVGATAYVREGEALLGEATA